MNELHASKTVAARVRDKRQENRWSMRELAERSGLPEDVIEAIENRRRRRGVTVDELMVLANALSIPAMLLLPPAYDYLTDDQKQRTDEAQRRREADAPRRAAERALHVDELNELVDGLPRMAEELARMRRALDQIPPGAVIAVERDGKLVPVE